ncbi:succinyl-diaminopimelate desuccinylase [Saxibacter everestensis]|uniref:Succinyl-diaminopimelate desuccinylase n=1 Tax=Saxibacter everestensis TaxID=2909229 RepID=A0ABY8QQA1_9MICO|nr:succinyl-diaminopimelate desuccinylase [Brevibacteriaceae bacterium ZFBP1038]
MADVVNSNLLDLDGDVAQLTRQLCDIESVSGNETAVADAVEHALRGIGASGGTELEILRDGDTIVARTRLGKPERVVIAGHLDTVPLADNLPTWLDGDGDEQLIYGRGTADMKAGVAMQLSVAAALRNPQRDISWVFYDHEEVNAELNGLRRVTENHPDWLAGDFAVLGEPTKAGIEGGCNGTLRAEVTTRGRRAHSARAWMGVNAIHAAGHILSRLEAYQPQAKNVDGLDFQESLSAVAISGGVAGNVIPDECVVTVNYRFAPSMSASEAAEHLGTLFEGFELRVTDSAEGARPGLDRPAAAEFVAAIGGIPEAKVGWTDVARFSALGVPAVNFGPGDPLLAHKDDEHVPVAQIYQARDALLNWLEG